MTLNNSLVKLSLIHFLSPIYSLHAETLTLKEAVQYAINHAPTLDSARRELEVSQLQKASAFSSFLPSLDLTTGHGVGERLAPRISSQRAGHDPWVSRFSLSVTENLYDNHQSVLAYKASKIGVSYSTHAYKDQLEQLARDIAKLFYDFSLSQKLLTIEEEQYKLTQQQFHLVEAGYKQGLRTREDYLRLKTSIHRLSINLATKKSRWLKHYVMSKKPLQLSLFHSWNDLI
jgi:outer membrane protein